MQLNRIRALSFDLDDTLWPFRPCLVRAEAALLTWLRTHAPGTQPLLSDPSALMTYRAQAQQQFPALRTDLSGLRRASIRALLEASQEDIALVEPAFEVFFEERQRVELYPEVLQALTQLSERLPLVALTNGNACIHKAGIGHFFKGALSAASLGVAKPEQQAFHAAAALAGVHPSEVLHVGDDWHLDVVGAVAAGAQAVWMVREDLAAAASAAASASASASAASNASASLSASASAPGADSVPHLRVAHLTELCEVLAGLH